MIPLIIVGIIILIPLIAVIAIYNSLINLKNLIKNSWSDVDTELKRRYDLIPNLVETVKGYAKHEREVFERVTEARARAISSTGRPASQAQDENKLISSMKSLFAVAERYPDLKASQQFLKLQEELTNTENRIQRARRFYNGNVKDYNNKIEMFPSSIIAGIFGFQKSDFFEIEEIERELKRISFV